MLRIVVAALALILPLAAQGPETHTAPVIVHKVQPKYSKKAKKNKVEGTVTLSIIIGPDGKARNFEVKKSLDPDLDAKGRRTGRRLR